MILFVLLLIMPETPSPRNWKPCFRAGILHNRLMKILRTTICILAKTISIEMTKLLRKTISYHDYKEDYYHAFLAGIFAGAGYMVDSNKEHGEGRSDVVVYDSLNGRVAVFEAKYAKSLNDLDTACEKAVQQMNARMYAKSFEDDYDEFICYGISFFKKRCVVMKK